MTNKKIFCPNCFSKNLYRYGKDPIHNVQKYQCKNCKKQFTELSLFKLNNIKSYNSSKSKYPNCPVCGKSSYLHHDYKHYSIFTCNNKKCKHSFKVIKSLFHKNSLIKLIFLLKDLELNLILSLMLFTFILLIILLLEL